MSRTIDVSDPTALSDEDLQFALSHNLLDKDAIKELGLPHAEIQAIIQGTPRTKLNLGHAGPQIDEDEYKEFLEFRRNARKARKPPTITPDDESAIIEPEDDYEGMSNDVLRGVLADRLDAEGKQLELTGKKDELIARLRANDAEMVAEAATDEGS